MLKTILKEANRFVSTESKKALKNIGWLFFDKVFRMGMALVIGAWVARYLGPTQFGSFNYLMATIGILGPFAALGLDSMIVKEIVDNPQRTGTIVSTAVTLRLAAGFISFLVCVGAIYFLKHDEMDLFYIGVILALTLISQSLTSLELYYQSQVKSRIAVVSQSLAYIIMSATKVVLILAIVTTVEMTLSGLFMLVSYTKISKQSLAIAVEKALAKRLLQKSWPLIFAGFMIMIYMRIDQIMIGELIGDKEVGTYSAALKLSEIWYFLAAITCKSFFPSIIEARKSGREIYYRRLQKLFDILFLISFSIAVFVSFLSGTIINILYGDQYAGASTILSIHIWTAVFVFFGVASNNFYVIEDLQIKSFNRTALGAVLNVGLNFLLIPRYGATGAAVATLCTQIGSSYIFDAISSKTRILFTMKTRSLFIVNLVRRLLRK
jgi:PST family polysaccharide transporter